LEKKVFYKVPEDAWMFRKASAERVAGDKKWTPDEEAVRQWCIQELIRTYGVRIDRIKVECQVKVARERRPNRVDVVVLRDGHPYVVVECKARCIKKLDDALQQAMNYAVLPDMQATFAVATNGDAWLVRRCVNTDWVPVADLPQYRECQGSAEWRLILLAVQDLSPILFWLDRLVPAKQASCYFSALQRLFYGSNEITAATDHNLLRAADRVLRVLARLDNHAGYTGGKMGEACKFLNGFWASRGIETDFGGGNVWEMAHGGYAELSALVENSAGTAPLDTSLMRVLLSLFGYLNGVKALKRVQYAEVSDSVQREIRSYLNLALIVRFDAELPDPLDKICVGDIHTVCESSWMQIAKEPNLWSLIRSAKR
jgi:hypothetical protein